MQLTKQLLAELLSFDERLRLMEARLALETGQKSFTENLLDTNSTEVVGGGTYGGGGSTEVCVSTTPQEGDRRSKRKGETATSPLDVLPDFPAMDTPTVRKALDEWYAYRKERGLAKWQTRTLRMQLEAYAEAGPSELVAAIKNSIGQGYHGLFAPRGVSDHKKAAPVVPVNVQAKRTGDDDIRDEWFALNSRTFGYIPKWPGIEQARKELPDLREESRRKRGGVEVTGTAEETGSDK